FLQNLLRQADAVNAPATLRWNGRGRIVEILILRLEKAIIDLIQLVAEDLLRCFNAMRCGICRKQNPVLILVEELARHAWLSTQLADTSRDIDVHVRVTIETLRNIRQIFRIRRVKCDELCARVSLNHSVP